ncbi:MAG: hypothetical protein ACYDA3_08155 [Gaiellaceae bacterium]
MTGRAKHPDTPTPESYRRRFPLELTPSESDHLEHHARTHGSKRAALLAGLNALTEHDTLTTALQKAEQERDELNAGHAVTQKRLTDLERQLAKTAKEASEAKSQSGANKKRENSEKASTNAALKQYQDALSEEQDLRAELENDLNERAVDYLYCHRCSTWTPPDQWAEQEGDDGTLLYHERCGFHRGGAFDKPTILALRDTAPGA